MVQVAVTEAELPGPIRSRQAGRDPTPVVPTAIGLRVHLQAGLQEGEFFLVQTLHFIFRAGVGQVRSVSGPIHNNVHEKFIIKKEVNRIY